eukprot:6529098-Lingulodinium_polyedra.AAC.1
MRSMSMGTTCTASPVYECLAWSSSKAPRSEKPSGRGRRAATTRWTRATAASAIAGGFPAP